tara:strand:- start:57 stop:329 length:273 start_codon:yes stop_codon:yes gene_type:complete
MKDIPNNFYKLDIYGKSSKRLYNPKGKAFGYHILGFGGFTPGVFGSVLMDGTDANGADSGDLIILEDATEEPNPSNIIFSIGLELWVLQN